MSSASENVHEQVEIRRRKELGIEHIKQYHVSSIQDAVLKTLQENSGGMKMTALVVDLTFRLRNEPDINVSELIETGDLDRILDYISFIRVHEYDWDMSYGSGTGHIRRKQFVCTKF